MKNTAETRQTETRARGRCHRCGGLMVSEFSIDLLNSAAESELAVKRCVQCGEVVDAVIQRNRRLQQEPMTVRKTEMLSEHSL